MCYNRLEETQAAAARLAERLSFGTSLLHFGASGFSISLRHCTSAQKKKKKKKKKLFGVARNRSGTSHHQTTSLFEEFFSYCEQITKPSARSAMATPVAVQLFYNFKISQYFT